MRKYSKPKLTKHNQLKNITFSQEQSEDAKMIDKYVRKTGRTWVKRMGNEDWGKKK